VLYEMACGRRAFAGDTSAAVSDAILHSRPTVPVPVALAGLQPIVDRLLEKQPERRYPTASEVAADLRKLRDRRTAPREDTVSAGRRVGPGGQRAAVGQAPARQRPARRRR
jgi:serine/threonine-protein kinase